MEKERTNYFDVVIAGAGPAGLKCAETLGNSEYSVLLLEKNSEIGPKICAGALTNKTIKYLDLPQNLIDFQYNTINIYLNHFRFKIKDNNNFAYIVDRKNLGQWQLNKLRKFKNIKIRTNSKVSMVGKNFVIANNQKIFYKFLVGADGSLSIVRRYLKIKSLNIGIGLQYAIQARKYKDFEVFFNSKLFSMWYAWIFPHKNYISIGSGCDSKVLSPQDLVKNFNKWIEKNHIDIRTAKLEAAILNFDYRGYRFGNTFLVGDAAGFISKLTGEGIYQALVSGEEVGKIILNNKYHSNKINKILKYKKTHDQIADFLIKCGKLRIIIYYIWILLLKIPYMRKKIINLLV